MLWLAAGHPVGGAPADDALRTAGTGLGGLRAGGHIAGVAGGADDLALGHVAVAPDALHRRGPGRRLGAAVVPLPHSAAALGDLDRLAEVGAGAGGVR